MNNSDTLNNIITLPNGYYEDEFTGRTVSFITNAYVYGLGNSMRASKFPMKTETANIDSDFTTAKKLAKLPSGTGEDNWLTGVIVNFDLKFTIKAWVEFERYHFAQIISSQSTMHKITEFDFNIAYNEYVNKEIIYDMKHLINKYNIYIEENPDWYKDELKKDVVNHMYLEILYSNPCGMYLTAGITTNYRQLKTMYNQRKNHRLQEWREFCKYIKKLPLMDEILD